MLLFMHTLLYVLHIMSEQDVCYSLNIYVGVTPPESRDLPESRDSECPQPLKQSLVICYARFYSQHLMSNLE